MKNALHTAAFLKELWKWFWKLKPIYKLVTLIIVAAVLATTIYLYNEVN